MVEPVADIQDAKRKQTITQFEQLRGRGELVIFSDHFVEQRMSRLPGVSDTQIRRVVSGGSIVKVGPGKYRNWKVQLWRRTAGEIVTVVCDVREDCLVLITCWEGRGDGPIE